MHDWLFRPTTANIMHSAVTNAVAVGHWYQEQTSLSSFSALSERGKQYRFEKFKRIYFNQWLSEGKKAKLIARNGNPVSLFKEKWIAAFETAAFDNCVQGD